jgi:hypothetical protein
MIQRLGMSTPEAVDRSPCTLSIGSLVLALALLLVLVLGLGRAPLFDVDEGAFSEATREMLVSGDWGHTTLHGADRFDKPIGVYWLQAISASVFGLNEFAVRLPSALATWLAALALWGFVSPRWGRRHGALSAVIHVTGFGTWAMAHAATADALLGLCLMLSAVDLWRYLESAHPRALRRLGIWVGLGLLVKGPVALLIPTVSLVLLCMSDRQWKSLGCALSDARAWLGMLLVAVPWYAYAFWRHGQAFLDGFILRHNIERFTAPMEGHSGGWFYFLLVAPLLWLPWSPLLLSWRGRVGELWSDAAIRRALVWVLVVLVFFSVSGTKLPHYGLYAAPGMVILLVGALDRARPWLWKTCLATALIWHVLLLCVPMVWVTWPDLTPMPLTQVMMTTPARIPWLPVLASWGLLAFALVVLKRRTIRLSPQLVLVPIALLHAAVMALVIWPWWAITLQGPIKELAIQARKLPGNVAQVAGNWPSFAFYRQQALSLTLTNPELLLTRLHSPGYAEWETIASAQGMVLLRKQPQASPPESHRVEK